MMSINILSYLNYQNMLCTLECTDHDNTVGTIENHMKIYVDTKMQ